MDTGFNEMALRHFVEEVALVFEQAGLPRMAARIFGYLMISDPPHQNSAQLAEALNASRGSVSSMTRLLVQFSLIERLSLPGDRSTYFRIKPGGITETMRMKGYFITRLTQLFEQGLETLGEAGEGPRGDRLREIHDFYLFMDREYPALLERWQRSRLLKEGET